MGAKLSFNPMVNHYSLRVAVTLEWGEAADLRGTDQGWRILWTDDSCFLLLINGGCSEEVVNCGESGFYFFPPAKSFIISIWSSA